MTVPFSTGRSTTWTADGTNRNWDFPFKILASGHVYLEIQDLAGTVSDITTGFTVVGVNSEDGGTITYPVAPTAALPAGYKVTAVRSLPLEQPYRIGNQGGFHAETHERALDMLEMQIQQLARDGASNAVRAPSRDGDVDMTLPAAAARAGHLLEFDNDGMPKADRGVPEILQSAYDYIDSRTIVVPGQAEYASLAAARAVQLPDVPFLRTAGYSVAGDGGGALLRIVSLEPAHSGKWSAQNGKWLELAENAPRAEMFGATTDATDNAPAINAMLNYVAAKGLGVGYVSAGTWTCGTINIPSNVTLELDPRCTIKARADLGPNAVVQSLFTNNVGLRGGTIDGNNRGAGASQTLFTELVGFRVTGLTVENVKIQNHQFIGLGVAESVRVRISGCEFSGLGYQNHSPNAGPAVWIATVNANQCRDVIVEGNIFRDNYWHGMHLSAIGATVRGNLFRNNKEAHIFAAKGPSLSCDDVTISGNTFDTVRRVDISAHAIECGATRVTITGNTIRNCDHGGIALLDVAHAVVSGNVISNFNQWTGTPVNAGGVDILSTPGNQPKNITVSGNTIFDDRSPVTGYAAVIVGGSGLIPVSLLIEGNNASFNSWASGKAIYVQENFSSSNSVIRNNFGGADLDIKRGSLQGPATTGTIHVSGVGFRPRSVELMAVLPSAATLQWATGSADAAGNSFSQSIAANGTVAASSHSVSTKMVRLLDPTGAEVCVAEFAGYSNDGFFLNFTNVTARPWIHWKVLT